MLDMLVKEQMVLMVGDPSSVTPKKWRDEPLFRILAERRMRSILSLRHPCPDRAILSFVRTWYFWERYGPLIPAPILSVSQFLRCKLTDKVNSGGGYEFQISEGLKGSPYKRSNLLPSFLYEGQNGRYLIYPDFQENL